MTSLNNSVNFVLQPKGGVGKSFVASIFGQYVRDKGLSPVCYDTDPSNKTLSGIKSLNAKEINLLRGTRVGEDLIDPMMAEILENPDATVLVDTGASNFLPTMAYLADNGVVDLLRDAGRPVIIHVPIAAGQDEQDTLEGLAKLATTFVRESGVGFVVWENDLRGIIRVKDYPIYDYLVKNKLLSGIVPIRIGYDDAGAYRGDTFINDIRRLTESRFTVNDMVNSDKFSNGDVIDVMKKHRIMRLYKEWYAALEAVNWDSQAA